MSNENENEKEKENQKEKEKEKEKEKLCNLITNIKGKKKLKPIGIKPQSMVHLNFILII